MGEARRAAEGAGGTTGRFPVSSKAFVGDDSGSVCLEGRGLSPLSIRRRLEGVYVFFFGLSGLAGDERPVR